MQIELIAYTQGNPKWATYQEFLPTDICAVAASQCYNSTQSVATVRGCIRSGHESVIEHVSFTFLVEGISRACLCQWTRHRLMSYSVKSQRYCKEDNFDYVEPPSIWEGTDRARDIFESEMEAARTTYEILLKEGVKPEDARMVLPNACCTNMVVTMNARSLRNFFKLRMSNKAQWEIREAAGRMFELVMEVAPELFEDMKEKA